MSLRSLKFKIATLGCKVNQSESSELAGRLIGLGLRPVEGVDKPDICVINTCTVTSKSDYQSRQLIRRAIRDYPGARVFVTGCYTSTGHEALGAIDGIHKIVPLDKKLEVKQYFKCFDFSEDKTPTRVLSDDSLMGAGWKFHTDRSRAFLKIQDGCNNRCAYCVVWKARGSSRSVPRERILTAAERIEELGFSELILTGVHVGFWGMDLPGGAERLSTLLGDILRRTKSVRIRLSSIEPTEIDGDLISLFGSEGRLCRHFHIPLQSADNRILDLMGRKYSAETYFDTVYRLKARIPGVCIGADMIVGFPGEDEGAFETSMARIGEAKLSYIHVFPYSSRPGTRAAAMGGQVRGSVRKDRAKRMRRLSEELKESFESSQIGGILDVVVEGNRDNAAEIGLISDNYIRFRISRGQWDGFDRFRVRLDEGMLTKSHAKQPDR